MDQYIGKMLDNRYEIIEVIGTGGMAVVYKARCHRLNRLVAIKILRSDLAQDAEFRRRFHDESQAVAMLSHPNIMAVYDVSRGSEAEYIVMELIDGITLKQYMQKKDAPLNWREALHFITQISKALSHAHSRGIIHRDIKPQNVMVLRDGSVKVTDFGIARLASASQNTLTQEALGSVHYISPEQARGSHIDARSDLYSAGVVLYEMLTGQLPFEGDTPVSVAIQHINSIPLTPRELNPDIPEALEEITLKAMAPNMDQRYANADAMLVDLEEFRKNPSINFEYMPVQILRGSGDGEQPWPSAGARRYTHGDADAENEGGGLRGMMKRRRRHSGELSMPMALGAIGVFLVGILLFLWITFFSDMFASPTEFEVPDLANLTMEEILSDKKITAHFTVEMGEPVVSETVPEGQVVSQIPEAGKKMKGSELVITVRLSGAEAAELVMPDLAKLDYREAILAVEKLGLTVAAPVYEPSDTITRNYVISFTPLEGNPVTVGEQVHLVISQGPEIRKVTVLSFVDQKQATAEKMITDSKLNLGSITEVDSEKEAGIVVWQSTPAGTEVSEGSTITLQVSKGKSEVPVSPPVSPSASPVVTPIPSVPGVAAVSRNIKIALPDTGADTISVRVDVGGVSQFDSKVQRSLFSSISPTISGTGKQTVTIYFDGVLSSTQEIDFSA